PVAGATVRIEALRVGAVTRPDGAYRLVIPAGRLRAGAGQRYTITASRLGMEPRSRTVTLAAGATVTQNFVLRTSALSLEGVVVDGVATGQAQDVTSRGAPADAGGYEISAAPPVARTAQAPQPSQGRTRTRGDFDT